VDSEGDRFFDEKSRMPWKTTTMNDVRKEFALKALVKGANLTALCLEYGVTRKTGREWRERARREGINQLAERSRRPKCSPQRLGETMVCQVVRLKVAHPHWGPKKISALYVLAHRQPMSVSSCHRILQAAGLVAARQRRVRHAPSREFAAVLPRAPNDVWTIDFKGWWRIIKSDNGVPFANITVPQRLSRLSAGWVALGIRLEHSRPGHPQDNPAHERMHKDIQAEVAAKVQVDARAQQAALDLWRQEYNELRPHETLKGRRPAEVYCKSPRAYPAAPALLDYGPGFFPRKVVSSGTIHYAGRPVFITTALAGWSVGLRIASATLVEVWFNYLLLGTIDLQTNRFDSAPSRSVKALGLAA